MSPKRNLSPNARLVLMALCLHSNRDGHSFPSVGRLREETQVKRSAMTRALNELVEKGLMTRRLAGGRKYVFSVDREAVLGVEPLPLLGNGKGSHYPIVVDHYPIVVEPLPLLGNVQKGANEGGRKGGGEIAPPLFSDWIGELPEGMRKKLGELERLWDRLVDDPARVIGWTVAAREAGELPREARFILGDKRWLDEVWPGVQMEADRVGELESMAVKYDKPEWWPLFEEWALVDLGRPLDVDLFWTEEMNG